MYKLFLVSLFLGQFLVLGQKETPKLVVGIVVDQMRADYLYRFANHYGEDGLKRLMREGINFQSCHYNYVPTFTGPGHASIYTGTTPANHGIVGNAWWSKEEHKRVNCVEDQTSLPIGSSSSTEGNFSPKRLKSNTITDQVKLMIRGSKVVSISIKNRGAILPGGHTPDGVYWFDYATGGFMTGSYYTNELPTWVQRFNKENNAKTYLPDSWETIKPIELYNESREDMYEYEASITDEAPVFPYNLKKAIKNGKNLTNLFVSTPFANTFLTDFAIDAILHEGLGQDAITDYLAISYSSPDIIGHSFGPYSKEMQDVMIRLDRDIAKLLKELDERIGKDDYVLFLTADHAVEPIPQYLIDHNMAAGYFFHAPFKTFVQNAVNDRFGAKLISDMYNFSIYIDDEKVIELGLDKQEVVDFIRKTVIHYPNIKQVYDSKELLSGTFLHDWSKKIALGFHPAEAGDILYTLEPGYLSVKEDDLKSKQGTSHGSAFSYDTQVPLLFFGKGLSSKNVYRDVDITDITPTLSIMLGLTKPSGSTGAVLVEVLEGR
jgi:predicted AlkP superfamily pyrophosphatase or phosphodiesterase